MTVTALNTLLKQLGLDSFDGLTNPASDFDDGWDWHYWDEYVKPWEEIQPLLQKKKKESVMTYTKGIRKIFNCNMLGADKSTEDIIQPVDKTGYKALCYRGIVWIKTLEDEWVATPFTINDFEL